MLALATYRLALRLPPETERLAVIASRTSLILVNFGFWVGSLWGDSLWFAPAELVAAKRRTDSRLGIRRVVGRSVDRHRHLGSPAKPPLGRQHGRRLRRIPFLHSVLRADGRITRHPGSSGGVIALGFAVGLARYNRTISCSTRGCRFVTATGAPSRPRQSSTRWSHARRTATGHAATMGDPDSRRDGLPHRRLQYEHPRPFGQQPPRQTPSHPQVAGTLYPIPWTRGRRTPASVDPRRAGTRPGNSNRIEGERLMGCGAWRPLPTEPFRRITRCSAP